MYSVHVFLIINITISNNKLFFYKEKDNVITYKCCTVLTEIFFSSFIGMKSLFLKTATVVEFFNVFNLF